MSTTLKTHQADAEDNRLTLRRVDPPDVGGASPLYSVSGFTPGTVRCGKCLDPQNYVDLKFQDGPLPTFGANGLTNEVLLAIVADRLEGFQAGSYPNEHNAHALRYVKEALSTLHLRTRERRKRGVEGKLEA